MMPQMNPLSRRVVAVSMPALLALLAGGLGGCQVAPSGPPRVDQISGKYIAVICDADMGAEAFYDGNLNRPRMDASDTMTVLDLPISTQPSAGTDRWNTGFAQFPVSNSVMGPPVALAVSPDGTQAFVVESRGPAGPGATKIGDLPPGDKVTSIDLSNPMNPTDPVQVEVGTMPMSVDVHPMGDLLAVTTARPGQQLVLVPVANRVMGQAMGWPLLGIDDANAAATSATWSPNGRYLAVTLPDRNQVVFYEFSRTGSNGEWGLAPYGAPVSVGKYPFHGKWSPDGRFFITTDLHWGSDVEGYLLGAPPGTLSVIRISDSPSAVMTDGSIDATVQHQVVSTAQVGISPEGLAISPDGRYVVTSNLRRSMKPGGGEPGMMGGSISLLSMGSGGVLTNHGEVEINAMPEGIAFDAAGRHVLVTQFRSNEPGAVDGEMAFYRLDRTNPPQLVPGQELIGVGVGPHGVIIVR